MDFLLRNLWNLSASSVSRFLSLQSQDLWLSEKQKKHQPLAGKLVDGRPAPTMTVERGRLAGRELITAGQP